MRWQNQTHGANCTKFIYKDILYWCLVGIYFGKLYHEAPLTHAHITWEPDLHENTIANLYENMNGNGACVYSWAYFYSCFCENHYQSLAGVRTHNIKM